MTTLAALTCESANLLGWQIGGATATLGVVLMLVRILLSPALGPDRLKRRDRFSAWRRTLHYLLLSIPVAWLIGAIWLASVFPLCYARGIAIASTIVFGVFLLVAVVTAGNQIGRRSVQ